MEASSTGPGVGSAGCPGVLSISAHTAPYRRRSSPSFTMLLRATTSLNLGRVLGVSMQYALMIKLLLKTSALMPSTMQVILSANLPGSSAGSAMI